MKRLSSIWKNILLVLASTGVALISAEGVVRLVVSTPPRIVSIAVNENFQETLNTERLSKEMISSDDIDPLIIDTPTGLRLRPNAHVRIMNELLTHRNIDIKTNSLGYRNRELETKVLTRVLFLGDSITFEDFAFQEETWVRLVERASWETKYPLETINTGIGGISLINELAILEETGISTEPDIVVLGFYLNDFKKSFGFRVERLPGWLDRSYLAWLLIKGFNLLKIETVTHSPFQSVSVGDLKQEVNRNFPPKSGNPLTDRHAFYQVMEKWLFDWGSSWSETHWERMTPLFHRFRQLADQHHFQPIIMIFPVSLQVYAEYVEDYPQRKMKEIGESLTIPVLDLLPQLRQAHRAHEEPIFHDHCHYTPFGDQILAKAILPFLQENSTIRTASEIPNWLKN